MAMNRDKLRGILSGESPRPGRTPEADAEDDGEPESEPEDRDLKVDLAADVADALRSEDDAALADALAAFVRHCAAGYSDPED